MARNDQDLRDLRDKIDVFATYDKEKLIHKPEWGSISLEGARIDP